MRSHHQFLCATQWSPGLDNGEQKLGDVLDTLPGANQSEIHWLVRLMENPQSPLAFPGQISLARHDALHVVLGRGLSNQDEAFVIGFTMGASAETRDWHRRVFEWVVSTIYPAAYRFERIHRKVFRLGLSQGARNRVKDVHLQPIETMGEDTVQTVRDRLGIDVHALYAAYRKEKLLVPDTEESKRLPSSSTGPDRPAIRPPDGADAA